MVERQPCRVGVDLTAEIVHAHAQQPDRPAPGIGFVQQANGPRSEVSLVARRRRGVAPRDRGEVIVAHLDRDRAREQLFARQPANRVARQLGKQEHPIDSSTAMRVLSSPPVLPSPSPK